MKSILFAEAPIDPFCIVRHFSSASLAFEKHRWTFYNDINGVTDTAFEYTKRKGADLGAAKCKKVVRDGKPISRIQPWSDYVWDLTLTKESIYFTLIHEVDWLPMKDGVSGIENTLIYNFVKKRIGHLYLAFQTRIIYPTGKKPSRVSYVVKEIFGDDSIPAYQPGIVRVDTEDQCKAVLSLLRCREFTDFYLFSIPPGHNEFMDESSGDYRGLFSPGVEELKVMTHIKHKTSYNKFVNLVITCEWMLTTHNNVPNETPYCFYSEGDLRPSIRDAATTTNASEPHTIIEIEDIYQLEDAYEVLRAPEDETW